MHTANWYDVIKLCCHFECEPYSPAETCYKKPFMSFLLQMFHHPWKSLFHCVKVLVFDAIHHWFSWSFFVWFCQNFRKIHIVSKASKCISKRLMFPTGSTKDIRNHKQNPVSFTNMIASRVGNFKLLSFWLIIFVQSWPWSFRTARMFFHVLVLMINLWWKMIIIVKCLPTVVFVVHRSNTLQQSNKKGDPNHLNHWEYQKYLLLNNEWKTLKIVWKN